MLRFHTLVITEDHSLKQALRRLGVAISSQVECLAPGAVLPQSGSQGGPLDLLIMDLRSAPRTPLGVEAFPGVRVIYLVEEQQLVSQLSLFQADPTASVLCHRGQLDDEEIIATARRVFRSYGFSPIDTPALEYLEILLGKGGLETDRVECR